MREAPERIWADGHQAWGHYKWCIDDVEYIRADLVEANLAKAVQALDRIAGNAPYADDPYDIARAALAELKGGKP
jgi:hypothetical protein